MKEDIHKAVNEAVERLVENFEEEFRNVHKGDSSPTPVKQRDPYQFR